MRKQEPIVFTRGRPNEAGKYIFIEPNNGDLIACTIEKNDKDALIVRIPSIKKSAEIKMFLSAFSRSYYWSQQLEMEKL